MIGFERMKSQLRAMINHDSGRFRRYIAVLSDGHPDRGCHHRRRVVDPIAHVKCLRFSRLLANDIQLFFRTRLRTDLGDTHLVGQVANLRFAIPGDDHHPPELVLRPQVFHKGTTLRAWRIAKAKGGGVAMIDQHQTFKAASRGR